MAMQYGFDLGVLSLPRGFGKTPKSCDTQLHFGDKPASILANDLEIGVIEAFVLNFQRAKNSCFTR
jgi:hypothetical protein